VRTNEVLQRLRMQVSGVDGTRAARMNVGQRGVPTRSYNAYERRSAMLTAYEQCVRMWHSGAYQ